MRSSLERRGAPSRRRLVAAVALACAATTASMGSWVARSQPAGAPAGARGDSAGEAAERGAAAGAADGAGPAAEAEPGEADDGEAAAPSAPAPPAGPADRDRWLAAQLDAVLAGRPELARARVGVAVVDLARDELLYARAADQAFNLASNVKVLTAAAALARLGPEFRWRTTAYVDKRFDPATGVVDGDLVVRGRGDPTLRAEDLRALVHDLRVAGVREVRGQLVLDTSYFDDATEPPRFDEQPKERAGFRAPVGALALERSSVVVVVEPDPAGVAPARVRLEPALGEYVTLAAATVATVTTGRSRVRVETERDERTEKLELTVTGQVRADTGPTWIRRRIDDPARAVGEVLRAALAAQGIKVRGRAVGRGPAPPDALALASHDSAPLGEVIRPMNKLSDNFIAETVLKTLGAETAAAGPQVRPATWADGLAAMQRWLVEEAGLPAGGFRVDNGSGLFSASAVSPAQLVDALAAAWRDFRVGPDLSASLAVMGVDGTVRSRLARSAARGRVRAKTGTLATVSTLAGYVAVDGRRPLAFAILVNDLADGTRGKARQLQDGVLEACVAYLGGS